MKKVEVRKKVKALQGFYRDTLWFILGNTLFTFIWLTFDSSGTFWPKYTFLVWGTVLVIDAYRKGIMDILSSHISFLTPEWEEEKLSEIIEHRHNQHRIRLTRDGKK